MNHSVETMKLAMHNGSGSVEVALRRITTFSPARGAAKSPMLSVRHTIPSGWNTFIPKKCTDKRSPVQVAMRSTILMVIHS